MSRGYHAALLAAIGLALALLWFHEGPSLALDRWLSSGKQEVATVNKLLERDAAHTRAASAQHARDRAALAQAQARAEALADTGRTLLEAARTADQFHQAGVVLAAAGQRCSLALADCRGRYDSLYHADSTRIDSLRLAVRGLDTTLARGITVSSCRFLLLFPCPSRAQAFEAGGVAGVALALLLTHR